MTERLPSPRRPNARQRDSTYQTGQRCSDKRDHLYAPWAFSAESGVGRGLHKGWPPEELKWETAVLYKALAQSLTQAVGRPGLGLEQLRRDFQHHNGLIFTNLGWLPPQGVLAGPPIFGKHRAFAPPVADTNPLRAALRLRDPSFEDCIGHGKRRSRMSSVRSPGNTTRLDPTRRLSCSKPCGCSRPTRKQASLRRPARSCGDFPCGQVRAGCATARWRTRPRTLC